MKDIKAQILLVEDDKNLGYILTDYLEMSGYGVEWQQNGVKGLLAFKTKPLGYDLCILDVMLPGKDGFTLAADIRNTNPDVPLMFLTAKNMKEDSVKGFKIGADDYITKPFSTELLLLRIEAVLRRYRKNSNNNSSGLYQVGRFLFNYNDRSLTLNDKSQQLTRKEADVLRLLCKHHNKLLKREVALKTIWGENNYFMGRSMDVYITKLRKYLKDDPAVSITNVHGSGFRLEVTETT